MRLPTSKSHAVLLFNSLTRVTTALFVSNRSTQRWTHTTSFPAPPTLALHSGFGFVSFITLEDCEKALAAMHGAEVDGRNIRVEKARRNTGYQKTPGQCKWLVRIVTHVTYHDKNSLVTP